MDKSLFSPQRSILTITASVCRWFELVLVVCDGQ